MKPRLLSSASSRLGAFPLKRYRFVRDNGKRTACLSWCYARILRAVTVAAEP